MRVFFIRDYRFFCIGGLLLALIGIFVFVVVLVAYFFILCGAIKNWDPPGS